MDLAILNPSIQEFIQKQIGISVAKLALQKNPFPEVEWIAILNQIEAKTKAKEKLGWSPKITFEELVSEMVSEDYKSAQRDELIKSHGYQAMDYHE